MSHNQNIRTSKDFCILICEELGAEINRERIEKIRNELVRKKIIKGNYQKFGEKGAGDAILISIAISLPFSVMQNVKIVSQIKDIPDFINEQILFIQTNKQLTNPCTISVGLNLKLLSIKTPSNYFGIAVCDDDLSVISVKLSKIVFAATQKILVTGI